MSVPKIVNPLPYSDFRSDTATAPTPEMFAAMMKSSLGDDVYNEDESVKKLERYVATLTGHEGALFCSSGTMTNQLAHRVHLCNPPQSAMVDIRSHVFNYEAGGISFHSQAAVYPVMPANGKYLTVEDIASRLVLDVDVHYAPTRVISLENTLNGTIMPIEEIARIRELTQQHGIKLHLDGARLWHACISTGISMKEYCSYFDTVSLCLSKGIGAPIGSILVGNEVTIKKARHFRLLFGGGWRQAGILAEAALWGIKTNWPTMEDTHRRAKRLEAVFLQVGCLITNPVDTNMVWVDTSGAGFSVEELMAELAKEGIKISGSGCAARVVLHYQITDEAVERFVTVLHKLASNVADADMLEHSQTPPECVTPARPSTPITPVVGRKIEDSSVSEAATIKTSLYSEGPMLKRCLFEEIREAPMEEVEPVQVIPRKMRGTFINHPHQKYYSYNERELTKQAIVVSESEKSPTAIKRSQRRSTLLLEPEYYDDDHHQEEDKTMAAPRQAIRSTRSLDLQRADLSNALPSQVIPERPHSADKKKMIKLHYRISHSQASKALKRASSRLARWSGSILTREA